MRAFLITVLIILLLGAAGVYYAYSSGILKKQEPEIPPRTPIDYHVLQGRDGVPMEEAVRAGLTTANYAYLFAMDPINADDGLEQLTGFTVGGHSYDLGYIARTRRPEYQSLEFNLLGNWDELHFGFGFQDTEASDPENRWAIEFSINVDGETRYGPEQITPVDKPLFNRVEVTGANRITFVIRRVGFKNPFEPVLVDPFVLKTGS